LATINHSRTEDEVKAAFNLLGSTATKKTRGYTLEDRSVLHYGPVWTTFTSQVVAFFGVISPEHGSFSDIERGNSAYYWCAHRHLEESAVHLLTTSEARVAVDQVLSNLLATGHLVDKAVLDQVCCHWHQAKTQKLKNAVYFWDSHNGMLMYCYRQKRYSYKKKSK
jgi:hypothetical protein